MQLIKVKTNHEASSESIKFITDYIKKKDNKLNIAFTGGRFGKFFLSQLTDHSFFNNRFKSGTKSSRNRYLFKVLNF